MQQVLPPEPLMRASSRKGALEEFLVDAFLESMHDGRICRCLCRPRPVVGMGRSLVHMLA